MRKGFRKLATVGLAGVMTVGAATNVMAASRKLSLGGSNYADCYLSCSYNGAYASTDVYTYYQADVLEATVDLTLEVVYSNGSVEYVDSGYDEDTPNYGMFASASVDLSESLDGNIGVYGDSSHSATVDDVYDSCSLSESY